MYKVGDWVFLKDWETFSEECGPGSYIFDHCPVFTMDMKYMSKKQMIGKIKRITDSGYYKMEFIEDVLQDTYSSWCEGWFVKVDGHSRGGL